MPAILLFLLILTAVVAVSAVRELRVNADRDGPLRGWARWSAVVTAAVAVGTALLAIAGGVAFVASPFLGSASGGMQVSTLAVLIAPPLLEAGLLAVGGLLMLALRRSRARRRSLLTAALAGVAVPIAALVTLMAGFSAADFGGDGAAYTAILFAANSVAASLAGSVLVVVTALVSAALAPAAARS